MSQNLSVADVGNHQTERVWAVRFLLFIAGLGGLLYGIDVGIIAGALPYLQATSHLTADELSKVVAAVLLGSVVSTLFAGMLADFMGRKWLMMISGVLFVLSIPIIVVPPGYYPLLCGRLLQGISAGLVGVVVPLYLAECLGASNRGKGTGIFQWLLTLGIVAAAVIGYYFSLRVKHIEQLNDPDKLFAYKDFAWRGIFWVSLPPGVLFVLGSLLVPESPRWLFRRGKKDAAMAALRRTRVEAQAAAEFQEMEETEAAEAAKTSSGVRVKESLLHRKYVVPFLLACVILACNQLTGVNSIIGYNTAILIKAGLSDDQAHLGYVMLTAVNFLVTWAGVALVDRKGRKFLLSLGSAGIVASLLATAAVFHTTEKFSVDCAAKLQAQADQKQQTLTTDFNRQLAGELLRDSGSAAEPLRDKSLSMVVIYSYGDYHAATKVVLSDDKDPKARLLEIDRDSCVPKNAVVSFFSNPFANLAAAQTAPLKIENALITPVPSAQRGWLAAICIFAAMGFFAVGPGVCVWLALSELMPTRIRSNGMSIALLINQAVSTTIAAVFLPTVGKYGYATVFVAFAAFTVIYFVTATFFLPETKGKTLEEIEEHFSGAKK